jgi:hypothetical protein
MIPPPDPPEEFLPGQRVRLNAEGRKIVAPILRDRLGTVARHGKYVQVLWDGTKHPQAFSVNFLIRVEARRHG